MEEYIGLDVSMKETSVSIRRAGERIWRGRCASDPRIIAELIRKRAPAVKRVVFETGLLSIWFYHSLRTEGLPAICIDARHAKAALDMATNKTDANDADGLAQLAEVGFFREVRVKGFDSMLTRTLVAARTRLVRITTELSNQIRGIMKPSVCSFLPEREAPSRRMSGAFLPIRTDLHRSCSRCWKPGVAFASAPPNSDASWYGTRARVRLAASLCLFPASVRSPQLPSPQPLRGRTTSRNLDLLAPGSG
jgi:transposase